jgi:hypothetical protein
MKRCLLQESRRSVHDTFNVLTGEFEGFDYSNPKICHGGKGGGGTNTVTQNSQPPPQIMAAYEQALSGAQSASQAPLQLYQGNTVAPFTQDQNSAFGTINNLQGAATPFIQGAQNLIQQGTQPLWNGVQQFSPQAVQGYMSPYTQNVLNSQVALEQNQNAQQQSALQGNTIASGAWGGDRAGVASSILAGQQALANNSTNAGILNQGYNQGLQEFNTQQQAQLGANEANAYLNQQGAFGLANLGQETLATGLTGANAQLQSGNQQQTQNQALLNVPYQQFLQQQAYPFQTSQFYTNAAEGIGSNSGGTGTGTTTTPGPSTASQVGGGLLGAAGLFGSLGGFSSLGGGAGWGLAPLLFANRGGRIKSGLARGGVARGFAGGGDVPDLSISFIPNSSNPVHGSGPPHVSPPQATPPQNGSTGDPSSLLAALAAGLKGGPATGGMAPAAQTTWDAGKGLGMSFGDIAPQAAQASEIQNFLGPTMDSGFGSFMHRGGAAHYDDGGTVGGQSPMTAMYSGQQQPTQGSNLNNMTEQQLQNYLMRLPIGSPQSRTIQSVLQQKRSMPNVGAQAQGGFGTQGNQPMFGGYARGGFADGGDADGIYIDSPAPPDPLDPAAIQRQIELQNEVTGEGGAHIATPIPQSALVPPVSMQGSGPPQVTIPPPAIGGFGTQTAPAPQPHADVSDIEGSLNSRQHAEANPWLSLAKAGFAIAGGQSPYAMENIGRGAVAGIEDYAKQTREADTVNESVDKLLTEAKQHRDTLAQEQQKESDLQNYRQASLQQGKYTASRNPMTGDLDLVDTKTGEVKHGSGSTTSPGGGNVSMMNAYAAPMGPDGVPLSGDAYLATLPPQIAATAKQIAKGDVAPISGFGLRNPVLLAAQNAAQIYDPTWNGRRYAEIKQFDTGQQGNTTRAFNVATGHLALMSDLADALDNGDTKQINAVGNRVKTELGLSSAPTNFDALRQLVSGEVIKATTASAGALGDRETIQSSLDKASSPKIIKDAIKGVYLPAMRRQLDGLEQQYHAGTGLTNYKDKYLLADTRAALGYDTQGSASTVPNWAKGRQLQYSPSKNQYRDKATNTIYDADGNPVQ